MSKSIKPFKQYSVTYIHSKKITLLVTQLGKIANLVALFEVCIIKGTLLMCEVINEVGLVTLIQSSPMWQENAAELRP